MDVFLLEEDEEFNNLFITHTPRDEAQDTTGNSNSCGENTEKFLGLSPMDYQSPCSSLIKRNNVPHYSDISDDEMELDITVPGQDDR